MITRFAPSPTGPLHLGHAFSALTAFERAKAAGGRFLLRIEDGDTSRSRAEWEELIFDDLAWLGIKWAQPVMRSSMRAGAYRAAMDRLIDRGLVYPCQCRRRDITAALGAPQEGAEHAVGPDGLVYPGTCRARQMQDGALGDSLRLDMGKAVGYLGDITRLSWEDTGDQAPGAHHLDPESMISGVGDVVLWRRDLDTAAYHLSVVVDDADQGITEAVRGADLIEATDIHRLLQALLGLPTPDYHHHRLIRDENGKRLAKRDDAKAISKFRAEGASPADIRAMVGL